MPEATSLLSVYDGWEGYNRSLLDAIAPLSPEHLAFRPAPDLRSVGETTRHLATGRIDWLQRILRDDAPDLVSGVQTLPPYDDADQDAMRLTGLIEQSWKLVDWLLSHWTAADLERSFLHTYWGKTYRVRYQWVVWRILSHDMHHGGEIALGLGMQGISVGELGDLGGHLAEPEVVE